MRKLKVLEVINDKNRIHTIDFYRTIAILSVIIFHYNKNWLPEGYLGVDLFFIISGFLVSQPLINYFYVKEKKINYWNFIIRRGFKIWPSYYSFFLFGSVLAIFLLPDQVINLQYISRYLLFYRNYTGSPHYWAFDHSWSLAVEEHFYLILPFLFVLITFFFKRKINLFLYAIVLLVLFGILFKLFGYITKIAQYTFYTHNRIDALAWGVLLRIIVSSKKQFFEKYLNNIFISLVGIILLFTTIYFKDYIEIRFYQIFLIHTIAPISFFLILAGTYENILFNKLKKINFLAYYSYNWYLWHPIFVLIFHKFLGLNIFSFLCYLIVSFLVSIVFTIFVEEKALKFRDILLK